MSRRSRGTVPHVVEDQGLSIESARFGNLLPIWRGTAVHRTIALLDESIGSANTLAITSIASDLIARLPETEPVLRSLLTTVTTMVARYQSTFWLPVMHLTGVEVALGAGILDLVWFIDDFGFLIDELKTVESTSAITTPSEQVELYLELGRAKWGEDFIGLRVCQLQMPRHSAVFTAEGTLVSNGPSLFPLVQRFVSDEVS